MVSGKAGIIARIAESIFKVFGKDAEKAAAKNAAKHEAAKEAERKAIAQQLKRAHNPLDIVPKGAERPPFHEVPGGSTHGANYKWTTKNGQTVRVRVHGPDASAPAGSNAAEGVTYRVQVGQRYLDKNGNVHHKNVHNDKSPNYNPKAANDTHIPWPNDVPHPPWG